MIRFSSGGSRQVRGAKDAACRLCPYKIGIDENANLIYQAPGGGAGRFNVPLNPLAPLSRHSEVQLLQGRPQVHMILAGNYAVDVPSV